MSALPTSLFGVACPSISARAGSTAETTLLQFSRRRMATGARGIQAVRLAGDIEQVRCCFFVEQRDSASCDLSDRSCVLASILP